MNLNLTAITGNAYTSKNLIQGRVLIDKMLVLDKYKGAIKIVFSHLLTSLCLSG